MPPLTMEAREQHEQASLVDAKGRAFDGARGDESCRRRSAFSAISSTRERVRSAMKPPPTPEGPQAWRNALIARAARSSSVAASREPGTRSTARSERIRGRSSRLVPRRILSDRAAEEGSSQHSPLREVDEQIIDELRARITEELFVRAILAEVRRRLVTRTKASEADEAPKLEEQIKALRGEQTNLAQAVAMAKGSIPALVSELQRRQGQLNALEARLELLKTAPSVLSLEVRRLERETVKRLEDLRHVFGRNPEQARTVMERLLEGKLTFTPIETDEGKRYRIEGRVSLERTLEIPADPTAPYFECPQGDSKPVFASHDTSPESLRSSEKQATSPSATRPDPETFRNASQLGKTEVSEAELERAIVEAVTQGALGVAGTLAAALDERRKARAGNIVDLDARRRR
jgi:hypothetical protein